MAVANKTLAALVLGLACMLSEAYARSLSDSSAGIPGLVAEPTDRPCFNEVYGVRRKLQQFIDSFPPQNPNCTTCVYPGVNPDLLPRTNLPAAIRSAQAFTCGDTPAGASNLDTLATARSLAAAISEELSSGACQVGGGAACLGLGPSSATVGGVAQGFIQGSNDFFQTVGWPVDLPCADVCEVDTELARQSITDILTPAASQAYRSICAGPTGIWSSGELTEAIAAATQDSLAQALAEAVVSVSPGSCPAAL